MCTQEEQIEVLKIRIRKLEETTREELREAVHNMKSELDFKHTETTRYAEICKSNHEEVHTDLLRIMSEFKESLDQIYEILDKKLDEEEAADEAAEDENMTDFGM